MERRATIVLTEQDLRRASRLNMRGALREPRILLRLCAVWSLMVAAFGAALLAGGENWREAMRALAVFAPLAALAAFAFPPLTILIVAPMAIRRRFRQQKSLTDPAKISWTDDVYEVRSRTVDSRTPWAEYVKWRESADLLLLFLSDANFQVLPKRVLNQDQIADIRALLDRRA